MTTQQEHEVQKADPADVKRAEETRDRAVCVPAVDIYESETVVTVVADMPGVDEKHVDVNLENNVLTLTGHAGEDEVPGHELLYRGYHAMDFRRSFTLSDEVDRNRIKARMKNGVLTVTLPKAERAQPRKIAVEAGK